MAAFAVALTSEEEGAWNFEIGETVTLLWNGNAGVVIGRTEHIHKDVQYLVEYANGTGELVSQWLYDDAIDHQTVN